MYQSEGYVWPSFVANAKSVTRRNWKPQTAKAYVKGAEFDAYDTAPFVGGKIIGRARVTHGVYLERLKDCPDEDYVAEGFAWLNTHPQCIPKAARREAWAQDECSRAAFDHWRNSLQDSCVYVVRFEIISIEDWAVAKLSKLLEGALS